MSRALFALTAATLATAIFMFGAVYPFAWVPLGVVLTALAGWQLVRAAHRGRNLPLSPVVLAAAAFGGLVLAQYAMRRTAYPGQTLSGLASLAGCGASLVLGLELFRNSKMAQRWCPVAAGLVVALALEALVQQFIAPGWIYGFHDASYATPVGPFVYHNHYAGCMELLLPLALLYALPSRSAPLWVTVRRGLVPLLGLSAIVLSRSRGGLLVAGGETVAMLLLYTSVPGSAQRRRNLGVLLALGVGLLLAANWAPIWNRYRLFAHRDASLEQRLVMYHGAWRIWRSAPWLGTGFNTFASVYPRFAVTNAHQVVDHAHNDYLELLADTGVAGLGLALLFLAGLVGSVVRLWPERADPRAAVRLAAGIGALALAVHAAGDFEFHAPANAWLFFFNAGLLSSPIVHRSHHSGPGSDRDGEGLAAAGNRRPSRGGGR